MPGPITEEAYRKSVYITIRDESCNGMGSMFYLLDTENAQKVVDKYVEVSLESDNFVTMEYSEIEGTEEVAIRNKSFLGRGLIGKYEWDETEEEREYWLFYSDGSTWSISMDFLTGNSYKDFIGVLEKM